MIASSDELKNQWELINCKIMATFVDENRDNYLENNFVVI